jgi:hypothetical protein
MTTALRSTVSAWWEKTKKGIAELLAERRQVRDDNVKFLKGRPNPKQNDGRTNYKMCEDGHCVAVSNTSCTHKTGCPAGCGVQEMGADEGDGAKFSLMPRRKAKEEGGGIWRCSEAIGATCKHTRFLSDVKCSPNGVYSAALQATADEINAKVNEMAKELSGTSVDKGRAEPEAMGMASAQLSLAAIGCASLVIALHPVTGMCRLSATPLGDGKWQCYCGGDLLENAPCAKAKDGGCIGVLALVAVKMSGQRVCSATQASINKLTPDVLKPYLAKSSESSRKKAATSAPEGESKLAQLAASNADTLDGTRNLLAISLGLVRSLAAPVSPPPVMTGAFYDAAADWAARAPIALEVFRGSITAELAHDSELVAKFAAQGRRRVADGSIAGQQLSSPLQVRRTPVHAIPCSLPGASASVAPPPANYWLVHTCLTPPSISHTTSTASLHFQRCAAQVGRHR